MISKFINFIFNYQCLEILIRAFLTLDRNSQNSVVVLNMYFQYYSLWITNRDNSDWEVETCWWGWVVDRCWSDWPPGGCCLGGLSLSPYSPSCHVFLDWSSITQHTFSCWSTSMGNTPVNQTLLINFILWKCCFYHSENVQRKIMQTLPQRVEEPKHKINSENKILLLANIMKCQLNKTVHIFNTTHIFIIIFWGNRLTQGNVQ